MKFKNLDVHFQAAFIAIPFAIIANFLTTLITNLYESDAKFLHLSKEIFYTYYLVFLAIGTLAYFLYPKIYKKYKFSALAEAAGINDWVHGSKKQPEERKTESSMELCDERIKYIQSINEKCMSNDSITILSSDGSFFSCAENPQFDSILETAKNEVKIFLLDPSQEAKAASSRALSIGIDPIEFRKNIVSSIVHLKSLKNKRSNVKLRVYLYDFIPQFEIIKSDEMIWVSYHPFHYSSDEAPIYSFKKRKCADKPESLYCFFDEYLKELSHNNANNDQPINRSICIIEDLSKWKTPIDLSDENTDTDRCKREENSFKEYIKKLLTSDGAGLESEEKIRKQAYSVDSRMYVEKLIPEILEAIPKKTEK